MASLEILAMIGLVGFPMRPFRTTARLLAFACLAVLSARAGNPPPTITGFTPTSGVAGDHVVISGSGFASPLTVTFAGISGGVASLAENQVTVAAPSGVHTGLITVSTVSGSASTAAAFVVAVSPPTLTPTPVPTPTPAQTPRAAPTPTPVPTVYIASTVQTARASSHQPGVFTFNLSAPQSIKTAVYFSLSGTALNGIDYELLEGKVKVKPNRTSATVQIVPKGTLGGANHRKVKLILTSDNAYVLGSTTSAVVKIEK